MWNALRIIKVLIYFFYHKCINFLFFGNYVFYIIAGEILRQRLRKFSINFEGILSNAHENFECLNRMLGYLIKIMSYFYIL